MTDDLKEFIETAKDVVNRIDDNSNVVWSGHTKAKDLKSEIYQDLKNLEEGNMYSLLKVYGHFLPTSTFQDIYIDDYWDKNQLEISSRMDELYKRLKPIEKKEPFIQRALKWINN